MHPSMVRALSPGRSADLLVRLRPESQQAAEQRSAWPEEWQPAEPGPLLPSNLPRWQALPAA